MPLSVVDVGDGGLRLAPEHGRLWIASQLDRHSPTGTGREASAAALTSVTRPYSTSTWRWEPIAKPCSASHRPDMRTYGTIASGIIRRDMRRLPSFNIYGARAGRGWTL